MSICKLNKVAIYHVDNDWYQVSYESTYCKLCVCPFVYFLRQFILNFASLYIFTVAILNNSQWRPDTTSVVIGCELLMKLLITKCICANF